MLSEVEEYRGYALIVCAGQGRGFWRVLIQAGSDMPAISFFGGGATREKAIDEAKLRINTALDLVHAAQS